jgi:membrane-associated phospholipid phosphatase
MQAKQILWIMALLSFCLTSTAQTDSINHTGKKISSYIVPTTLVAYGLLSIDNNGLPSSVAVKDWRNTHFANFKDGSDDFLAFAPGIMMLACDAFKVKSASNFANQSVITAKAVVISLGLVNALKYTTKVLRPDGSTENSFPSGHTAFAFTLAELLHQEFRNKPFIYTSGYIIATGVGAMRILNNRHWYSDVLVGAGIGMLSTKIAYATHRYKWKMSKNKLFPIIGSNQWGFIYTF